MSLWPQGWLGWTEDSSGPQSRRRERDQRRGESWTQSNCIYSVPAAVAKENRVESPIKGERHINQYTQADNM